MTESISCDVTMLTFLTGPGSLEFRALLRSARGSAAPLNLHMHRPPARLDNRSSAPLCQCLSWPESYVRTQNRVYPGANSG